MKKESFEIMQNLGYTKDIITSIEKESKANGGIITKKILNILKDLGTPDTALKQIRTIEAEARKAQVTDVELTSKKNKGLIDSLIKRCRRSLDAFARKEIEARVVFSKGHWVIEAPEYNPAIQHLHDVCKTHFDEWASQGLNAVFYFDGTTTWQVLTKRKQDTKENE